MKLKNIFGARRRLESKVAEMDEIAGMHRRDSRWMETAAALSHDPIRDTDDTEEDETSRLETAFYLRERTVGALKIQETGGCSQKGASMVTMIHGDETRLFGAVVEAAGMGPGQMAIANRIAGLIRGLLATSSLQAYDLKRIVALATDEIALRNLLGAFVWLTAWILDRRTQTLSVAISGGEGLIIEHADGSETPAASHGGPGVGAFPAGIFDDDAADPFTVSLEGATAFRTARDGIANAVSHICREQTSDVDEDELEAAVRDAALNRRRLVVPRDLATPLAGTELRLDALDESTPRTLRVQIAAALLSLEPRTEVSNPVDEMLSVIDQRLAEQMALVWPSLSWEPTGPNAELRSVRLTPSFTPATLRVVMQNDQRSSH